MPRREISYYDAETRWLRALSIMIDPMDEAQYVGALRFATAAAVRSAIREARQPAKAGGRKQ